MNKTAIYAIAAVMTCGVSHMQAEAGIVEGVTIDSMNISRNGRYLTLDMLLDFSALKVDGNRAVLLTPRIVNGTDSVNLPAVGIYGRRRYYTYLRNGKSMLSGEGEKSFKASQKPDKLPYHIDVDYQEWMNGAGVTLERDEYGCCNSLLSEQRARIGVYEAPAEPAVFFPELVYVRPEAEMSKSRALEGTAYIDFPVNRTEIYPDYRRNTVELGKIRATIDSIRDDKDVTITQVWLKGFASPESPYSHNRDLAIGRTAALQKHIQQLYDFGAGVIATDYEPEDWTGLRRMVEAGDISHKQEILELIDSDRDPDNKEWRIKSLYPEEYRFMLRNYYPALRHTDYRIAYDIRSYSDVDEIKRIFASKPQNLSLNEFYILSREYEPDSDEFTEVFETAVRLFPSDPVANLNAANAAIRHDNFALAERYLAKAGESAEADYTRGALAIRKGDYDSARAWLAKAAGKGLRQASATLEELKTR